MGEPQRLGMSMQRNSKIVKYMIVIKYEPAKRVKPVSKKNRRQKVAVLFIHHQSRGEIYLYYVYYLCMSISTSTSISIIQSMATYIYIYIYI